MLADIKGQARYWGFLLVKLAAAAMGSSAALWFLNLFWPPHTPLFHLNRWQFMFDLGYTTLVMVWFLLSYGMLYLAFWDQRYRCRTCLHRLCMPVETGSWSHMLRLGRPKMEYICPFGHGTLNVEELQITGTVTPDWTQHGDIWAELFAEPKGSDKD
ncbi:MAG: hypothetical protein JWN34_5164 [Bryobacterales bacterium]|jgi:hypothetical protein|nr:hypothetical protein [Bryobacterales bacterium]